MKNKEWIRARSSEQIEERINSILEAAGDVFGSTPYERVTMQMIAKKCGLSRANLYNYYKSREEIFLTLFMKDFDKLADIIKKTFTKKMTIEKFAEMWTETLMKEERLLKLIPLLAGSLEKNSSKELYRDIKMRFNDHLTELMNNLQTALPGFTAEQLVDFTRFQFIFSAGLEPMTRYTKMQEKVLKEMDFMHFKYEFVPIYKQALVTFLKGLSK